MRAAMVIGAGSASFQMLEALAAAAGDGLPALDRHPHPADRGRRRRRSAGRRCATAGDVTGDVEIGGPQPLTYRAMMNETARALHRRPPLVVRVPVLSPRLSSYWVQLVTPVEGALVRPLVDGLREEMLVAERRHEGSTTPRATSRPPSAPPSRDADRRARDDRPAAGRVGASEPGVERMGIKAAVLGPGNIGIDLLVKLQRSATVETALMVGVYDDSPGLARARELGVESRRAASTPCARARRDPARLRRDRRQSPPRARAAAGRRRQGLRRPDAGRARALRRPLRQPRRPPRRARPQHGHVRRPGDDPDGPRDRPRRRRRLRRDRRDDLLAQRRPRHAPEHRRVHRDDGARAGARRRSRRGQGDHHPQPGRAADPDARHRLRAGARPRRGARSRPRCWRCSSGCAPTCRG